LRSIDRALPLQVIMKALLLLLLGLALFYVFLIAIAVMLFNIVLAFVCLIVFANYLKWAFVSLRQLRHQVGQRKTRRFL
jgi:Ca2+/Na+ antiporter